MKADFSRVHTLNLGRVIAPPSYPDAGATIPIQSFAVSSREGVLLIDAGVGVGKPKIDEAYAPHRISLATAMADAGVSADRVFAIALSHLHFDHIGGLDSLPGVPIYLQRSELTTAKTTRYTIRRWVERVESQLVLCDGEVDVGYGVRLIATPGHTEGHQSVIVESAEGIVALACQAVYCVEEWIGRGFHPAGGSSAWNATEYGKSLERLQSLHPSEVRFSHDVRIWLRNSP